MRHPVAVVTGAGRGVGRGVFGADAAQQPAAAAHGRSGQLNVGVNNAAVDRSGDSTSSHPACRPALRASTSAVAYTAAGPPFAGCARKGTDTS